MKKLAIHPLLFAAYPVLSLFAANLGQVRLDQAWRALFLAVAGAAFIVGLLFLILKNAERSSLISALLILLFFSYRHFSDFLRDLSCPFSPGLIFTLCGAAATAALFWFTRRADRKLHVVNRVLTLISLVMVALPLSRIALFQARGRGEYPAGPLEWSETAKAGIDRDYLPNIFYIILDAYARGDVLKELYDYDNRYFLNYLEDKGFFLADRSAANYAQTAPSLASALNYEYLDELIEEIGPNNRDRKHLTRMINENRVFRFVKQLGYTTVGFDAAGPYSPVWVRNVDRHYPFIHPLAEQHLIQLTLNHFEITLINSTPLFWIFRMHFIRFLSCPYEIHRHKLLSAFSQIEKLSRESGPLFVYAHLLIPHQPFVFAEDGTPLTPNYSFDIWHRDPEFLKHYKVGYTGQLAYLNSRLRELIDNVINNSTTPPVIILQADHGPSKYLDTSDPLKSNVKERMAILNAYYFPESGSKGLYPSISPVNSFRVLFNNYFGTDYPLLEDKSYLSSWDLPYKMYDVTGQF